MPQSYVVRCLTIILLCVGAVANCSFNLVTVPAIATGGTVTGCSVGENATLGTTCRIQTSQSGFVCDTIQCVQVGVWNNTNPQCTSTAPPCGTSLTQAIGCNANSLNNADCGCLRRVSSSQVSSLNCCLDNCRQTPSTLRQQCITSSLPSDSCNFDSLIRTSTSTASGAGCNAGGAVARLSFCTISEGGRACYSAQCTSTLTWQKGTDLCLTTTSPAPTTAGGALCRNVVCPEVNCMSRDCNLVTGACDIAQPDGTTCNGTNSGLVCTAGVCGKASSSSSTNSPVISIIVVSSLAIVAACIGGGFWRCGSHLGAQKVQPPALKITKKADIAKENVQKKATKVEAYEEVSLDIGGRAVGLLVDESLNDGKLCVSGVIPGTMADEQGMELYIGRSVLHVNGVPTTTVEKFNRLTDRDERITSRLKIGFGPPGGYLPNGGLVKDTVVCIHELDDTRELNGETGRVVENIGSGVSVHIQGKGIKYVEKENVLVVGGASAEQVRQTTDFPMKSVSRHIVAPFWSEGPNESPLKAPSPLAAQVPDDLVITKKKGEKLGLRLNELYLYGSAVGSPADKADLLEYHGRKITHVDDIVVSSQEQVESLVVGIDNVKISFAEEHRIDDGDGSYKTLSEFKSAYGDVGLTYWCTSKKPFQNFFPFTSANFPPKGRGASLLADEIIESKQVDKTDLANMHSNYTRLEDPLSMSPISSWKMSSGRGTGSAGRRY